MIAPVQDAVRFDTVTEVTWTQIVNASGLSEAELTELVQYGALVPRDPSAAPLTASRLRRDFDLDAHGVSVVLSYVERIESLEKELRTLRAQLG